MPRVSTPPRLSIWAKNEGCQLLWSNLRQQKCQLPSPLQVMNPPLGCGSHPFILCQRQPKLNPTSVNIK